LRGVVHSTASIRLHASRVKLRCARVRFETHDDEMACAALKLADSGSALNSAVNSSAPPSARALEIEARYFVVFFVGASVITLTCFPHCAA